MLLAMAGETHIAESGAGDLGPFPAIRGQGGCRDVGQGRVQLGQFEAPLSSRVEVSARGGFVQELFGFAVVIWTVHSVLLIVVRVVPGRAQRLTLNERRPARSGSVGAACEGPVRGRAYCRVSGPACWLSV